MKNEPFIIERRFAAPVKKVWKAIIHKDEMKQWYFDLPEFKPEVGFELRMRGWNRSRQRIPIWPKKTLPKGGNRSLVNR